MNDTHCTRRVAIKLAVTCMLAATTASVGWAELTTLVNKGDPSNRVDIVFLGDGYTQDDLDAGIYDAHIQSFLDTLFNSVGGLTEPMIRAGVGGRFYDRDIYRPSSNSKMKTLGQRFDAVSREAYILGFYELVDPLDDWLDNTTTLEDDGLWVDVIDPDVVLVDWYVDDSLVAESYGGVFQLADFGFTTGTFTVRAHAYDGVLPHAFDGDMLDLVRITATP